MSRVSANALHLYYEEFGAGAPILGIHGTPGSAVLWEEAARELAQIGRCIIYDRRGFGRSRPPEPPDSLDLAQHLDDAVALIDGAAGGRNRRQHKRRSHWRWRIASPRRYQRWFCSSQPYSRPIPKPKPGRLTSVARC